MTVLAKTDFFSVEVLTLRGLVTYYLLFFIHLESRKVEIACITPYPNEQWMKQIARNLTWALALFRGGRRQEAFNKLYQTMLENLYLVLFVLRRNTQPLDIWHGSNFEWIEYAVEVPQELGNLQILKYQSCLSMAPSSALRQELHTTSMRALSRLEYEARSSAILVF